jgi:hypothetical protein
MVTRYFLTVAALLATTAVRPSEMSAPKPFSFDDKKKLAKVVTIDKLCKKKGCRDSFDISAYKKTRTKNITPKKLSTLAQGAQKLLSSIKSGTPLSGGQIVWFSNNYTEISGLNAISISQDDSFKNQEDQMTHLQIKEDEYAKNGIRNPLLFTDASDTIMTEDSVARSSLSRSLPNRGVTKPYIQRNRQKTKSSLSSSTPVLPTTVLPTTTYNNSKPFHTFV